MKKLLTLAVALVALTVFSGPAVAQQSWSVAIEQNPMLTNCGATTNIPVAGATSCATAITAAQSLLTTLRATPNCMGPSCPAGYTMTPGVPSCTPDPYTRPNGSPAIRYQVNLKWNCVPPRVSCATPPPATNYNTGSTSANNVPLNQCYKNTAGECVYNFATPGTAGGWNTGCPPAIAGSNCCGWTPPPPTSCTQDITSGVLTISTPTVSSVTATSANLSGTVSVAPIPSGCTYAAKLVWGPAPTPPFPNTAATGSIPSSPLQLGGTAQPLLPNSVYDARIEVTKQCGGLAPTTCFGPTKRFETPKGCTITITKKTNPAGGTGFSFSSAWSGLQGITLNDGQSISKPVGCGPIFNVFELPKPGWALTNIACTFSGGTGNFKILGATTGATNGFEPGDNEVNFDSLTPGANLQCTYTNHTSCKDVTMNLSTGQNPNWTVSPGTVGVTSRLSPWVQLGGAGWIQPSTAGSPQLLQGGIFYQYSVPFTLPGPLSQYSSISLNGQYAADNTVHAFFVGPASTGPGGSLCTPANANCFSAGTPFSITAPNAFTPGLNTLTVRVYNNPTSGQGPTYTGLIVDATLRAKCK
jgi:hypothetical protein